MLFGQSACAREPGCELIYSACASSATAPRFMGPKKASFSALVWKRPEHDEHKAHSEETENCGEPRGLSRRPVGARLCNHSGRTQVHAVSMILLTVSELGGGIDELDVDVDLLGGGALHLRDQGLAQGQDALHGSDNASLDHQVVLVHLSVLDESAQRGDGLLGEIRSGRRVLGVGLGGLAVSASGGLRASADAEDLLVDLSTVMVTVLTSARDLEGNAGRVPGADTGDLKTAKKDRHKADTQKTEKSEKNNSMHWMSSNTYTACVRSRSQSACVAMWGLALRRPRCVLRGRRATPQREMTPE